MVAPVTKSTGRLNGTVVIKYIMKIGTNVAVIIWIYSGETIRFGWKARDTEVE